VYALLAVIAVIRRSGATVTCHVISFSPENEHVDTIALFAAIVFSRTQSRRVFKLRFKVWFVEQASAEERKRVEGKCGKSHEYVTANTQSHCEIPQARKH
jgi:hypothetical protein